MPFGYLKVGEVLSHEGKEMLLVGCQDLGEVIEDFTGFMM